MMATKKARKAPWLSGLLFALLGAVWMIGQVAAGIVGLIANLLSASVL